LDVDVAIPAPPNLDSSLPAAFQYQRKLNGSLSFFS